MSHHEPEMERLDILLMRVVDGEASEAERLELLELADAAPQLAELSELRQRLKSAVLGQVGDHLDVVGEVLSALTLVDGWDEAADELRQELSGGLAEDSLDLVDAVMAQVAQEAPTEDELLEMQLCAMVDGELSAQDRMALAARLRPEQLNLMTAWADQGRLVREALEDAVRCDTVALWPEVAQRIGLDDPEHIPGWEPIAESLRAAVAQQAELSAQEEVALTAAIMNGLPRAEPLLDMDLSEPELMAETEESFENTPLGKLFSSPGLQWGAALAVGLMVALVVFNGSLPGTSPVADPGAETPGDDRVALVTEPVDTGKPTLDFAEVNEAEVEELEAADEVMVQVFQLEEGAPMFLMIDEGDEGATL